MSGEATTLNNVGQAGLVCTLMGLSRPERLLVTTLLRLANVANRALRHRDLAIGVMLLVEEEDFVRAFGPIGDHEDA